MIVSLIKNVNYLYFSLHAEEVFTSNYIKDNEDGIYVSSLQYETIDRLYNYIKESNFKQKYIILDFKYILHLQVNILSKIIEIRDLGHHLIFRNLKSELYSNLTLGIVTNDKNILNADNDYDTYYFFSTESNISTELEVIELNEKIIFKNEFERILTENNYIKEYNEKHSSSFVYLHSFIDLKNLISNERPFIYFALYKLATKIKAKWNDKIKDNPVLVCQSITSTFLVSVLSNLLKLDILVFDKIGPITKLYKKLEVHNFNKRKYIIVSDLVCLGTEVKITKSLIEFSGGEYLGNVSLIKIETLDRDDLKLDNIDRTIAVFSVNKENNIKLNYYIYTNLNPLPA